MEVSEHQRYITTNEFSPLCNQIFHTFHILTTFYIAEACFKLINISNNAHFLACISAYLSKINMPYTISKLFNTFSVNNSYILTLRSVFVQANGELDNLSPFFYYELLPTNDLHKL